MSLTLRTKAHRDAQAERPVASRVNLLPLEIAEGQRFRALQRRLALLLAGSVAMVVAATLLVSIQVSSAGSALDSARATGVGLQAQVNQYSDVPKVYNSVKSAQSQLAAAMGPEVRWSGLLASLRLSTPRGVSLSSVTIRQDLTTPVTSALGTTGIASVTIDGSATTTKGVASFLDALAVQSSSIDPYFTSATRSASDPSNASVTFTATTTVTEAAKSGRYTQTAGK